MTNIVFNKIFLFSKNSYSSDGCFTCSQLGITGQSIQWKRYSVAYLDFRVMGLELKMWTTVCSIRGRGGAAPTLEKFWNLHKVLKQKFHVLKRWYFAYSQSLKPFFAKISLKPKLFNKFHWKYADLYISNRTYTATINMYGWNRHESNWRYKIFLCNW